MEEAGAAACLAGLVQELLLRIASYLTWHQARAYWSVLPVATEAAGQDAVQKAWLPLVRSLVEVRGHDEVFLADLSTLQDCTPYWPFIEAYTELYPTVTKAALSHQYSPNRMLEHVFAVDDAPLLRLLLETNRLMQIEAAAICSAVDQRAQKCLEVLLSEARAERGRVRLEFPRQPMVPDVLAGFPMSTPSSPSFGAVPTSSSSTVAPVDFDRFPQKLLWRAALTRDTAISKLMLGYLARAAKTGAGAESKERLEAAESRLRLWAACCGAACGQRALLAYCGPFLADFERISFHATVANARNGFQEELDFEETPLAVVATLRGHAEALEFIARCGNDLMLCTRRGLTALDAARQPQNSAEQRARLEAIILAPPGSLPPIGSSRTSGSRPGSGRQQRVPFGGMGKADEGLALALAAASAAAAAMRILEGSAAWDGEPVEAAIRRGDAKALRSLLGRGARLQQSDLMAAVSSGDLDMLSLVQAECKGFGGQAEYRKMMRQTASQIRADKRAELAALPAAREGGGDGRPRSSSVPQPRPSSGSMGSASSGAALRRAGESALRLPSIGAGRKLGL